MARRTIGLADVAVTLSRRADEGLVPLDSVGSNGLHQLVAKWALTKPDVTDRLKQIYTAIERVEVYSAAVLMEVGTGSWGDDRRRLVHPDGALPPRPIDADDASTVGTRALLLAPPGGDIALYFSEREGNFVGGSRIWKAIEAQIRGASKVPDLSHELRELVPAKKTVTMEEEWLEGVRLQGVAVSRVRPASSYGDSGGPEDLLVKQSIRASRKGHLNPRWLTDILSAGSREEAAGIVRLDGDDEIKTIELTVSDGSREKTFEIESPGTPALREVLNEHGNPVLEDLQFIDRCAELAAQYYRRIGQTFDYAWLR